MRRRQHIIACYLLGIFAVGGVLAPASHLWYMALGDAHAPMRELHTMGPAHMAHPDDASGPRWESMRMLIEPCRYVSIFSTLVLSAPQQHVHGIQTHDKVAYYALPHTSAVAAPLPSYDVRGPPAA